MRLDIACESSASRRFTCDIKPHVVSEGSEKIGKRLLLPFSMAFKSKC